MLYSKLFGKTQKQPPADASTASHKLLHQGGYIRESTAGRYFFLPLGQRVQQNIIKIVKEEMDSTGAQEMVSPVLHPLELWKETNRNNETGFELTTIKDRREAEFALGGTAEEMFVDCVRKFQLSYRDLPFNIYQFSTKFRDELRARGGLLRVREFIMKDAYSFDVDEENFKKEYKKMWDTYKRIYNRLGLDVIVVESDNGYIGGEYCHEFIVESEVGESKFLVSEDGTYAAHEDIAKFKRDGINQDEETKKMEVIDQPAWVQTMEHNEKHYKLPRARFLKNVVYKIRTTGEIIIAVIRGDLDINKTKLEHVLNAVGQLDDATDADLTSIGTKRGYVHSWGHKNVRYIGDLSLTSVKNFIGGQKEETKDTINVNYGTDFSCDVLADIALAKEGYHTEDGKHKLVMKKGIEVGNIFQLGYHYSNKMKGANYIDEDGKEKPYYMGCYGIGIGRTLATIVEIHHDDRGMMWPDVVAPYRVHLVGLDLKDDEIRAKAEHVYNTLHDKGITVLYDDRKEASAGMKFADADLIGIPVRLVVSKKTGDQIELKKRAEKSFQLMSLEDAIKNI
jgi:prolyl-tRNA synthetase